MHISLTTTLLLATAASAQVYGSGALGAFSPTTNVTLDTAANGGVFDYTAINIPAGVTVRVTGPNPAILLCQGAVAILGTLDASGFDQPAVNLPATTGGPGGYAGGGLLAPGSGPGGGTAGGFGLPGATAGNASHATPNGIFPAPTYGSALPFDLRGGSGGGGAGFVSFSIPPVNATGGGGTIVILAAGPITVPGAIHARGGAFTNPTFPVGTRGGVGSGGSILLRSLQSVNVAGALDARAGNDSASGGVGFIRIDSYAASGAPSLGGAAIQPAPFVAPLPFLTALAPARVGHVCPVRCASAPGDVVTLYASLGTAQIPVPPFGVVQIDPPTMVALGNHPVPAVGHDPLAVIDIPLPNEPGLIGITFHAQAINNIGSVAGLPHVSNRLPIAIGP